MKSQSKSKKRLPPYPRKLLKNEQLFDRLMVRHKGLFARQIVKIWQEYGYPKAEMGTFREQKTFEGAVLYKDSFVKFATLRYVNKPGFNGEALVESIEKLIRDFTLG